MASMLTEAGTPMHWTTLAKIEKGERSVRVDEAAGFAELFGCSIDALMGRRARPKADLLMAVRGVLDAGQSAAWQSAALSRALRECSAELSDVDRGGNYRELTDDADATADALDTAARLAERVGERPEVGIKQAARAYARKWSEED